MNRVALLASAGFGMAFMAACSDSPTAPARSAFVPKSSFAVGALTDATPQLGVVKVCKLGDVGGSFDVTRTAVGTSAGTVSGLNTLIATGECRIVAEDQSASESGSNVFISEDAAAGVNSAVTGCVFIGNPGGIDANPCDFSPTSRFINQFHGYVVTYTNTVPPTGNQGCTPGYWKQTQHFGSWAPVALNTTFTDVFGGGIYSGTLLEALGLNGGGINALIRHGAAAYLNAQNATVDYQYTTAQVIDIVQGDGDYAGLSIEARKNLLDAANNGVGGCPLDRAAL